MNTIEEFGDYATFCQLIKRTLTSFEDDVITRVTSYGFSYQNQLANVNLPNVTAIEYASFSNCSLLKHLSFPSLTRIDGQDAFDRCTNLLSIDLPLVESIPKRTFVNCNSLATVILRKSSNVVTLDNANAFDATNSNFIIYVHDSLVEDYKSATNWSAYADRIKPLSELPAEEEES